MGRAQGPPASPPPPALHPSTDVAPIFGKWQAALIATMLKMAVSNNLPNFESFTVLKTEIISKFSSDTLYLLYSIWTNF